MQIPPFVLLCKYGFWSHERTHSITSVLEKKIVLLWLKLLLTDTSKISLSDNVKLISWLPQNDILGHNKTRLFIAHAGINGLLESIYHGIPMICSPFFGDQFSNALMAQNSGFAEAITLATISSQELIDVIRKVINTPRWGLYLFQTQGNLLSEEKTTKYLHQGGGTFTNAHFIPAVMNTCFAH